MRRRRAVSGDVVKYQARPRRNERDEFPSEEDIERFSDVTTTCPSCGVTLYDDAEVCYQCGEALAGGGKKSPPWVAVTVGLVVVALIVAIVVWGL